MKIIVFSDSHGEINLMRSAIQTCNPDRAVHLGDLVRDAEEVQRMFPNIPFDIVKGNNDIGSSYPQSKVLEIDGRKLYLSHGDRYAVKFGLERIMWQGRELGVDAVLFGHTHVPHLERIGDMWIMNPGCIGRHTYLSKRATYGLIEISQDKFCFEIMNIDR
jgi:putative phosphoesterase